MGIIIRNIAAILLSLLIVAGNGGINIFAHSCNQQSHTGFYLDEDDVHCNHATLGSGPEISRHISPNDCSHEVNCCDTKTITLKFDQYTLKNNSEREQNFKPVLFLVNIQLPALTSERSYLSASDKRNCNSEIIPKLKKKKLLRFYTSNKLSSDPFPA